MNTITLYRVFSGFRNVEDGVTMEKPPSESVAWSREYILPDGYTVAESESGEEAIYDGNDIYCPVCLSSNAENAVPMLVAAAGMIPLKRAGDGRPVYKPLREARRVSGLTLSQLSEMTGINIRLIQKYERGDCDPGNMTLRTAVSLSNALGIEPRNLLPLEQ